MFVYAFGKSRRACSVSCLHAGSGHRAQAALEGLFLSLPSSSCTHRLPNSRDQQRLPSLSARLALPSRGRAAPAPAGCFSRGTVNAG